MENCPVPLGGMGKLRVLRVYVFAGACIVVVAGYTDRVVLSYSFAFLPRSAAALVGSVSVAA